MSSRHTPQQHFEIESKMLPWFDSRVHMHDIALWFDSRAHLENVQAEEKQMLLWRWFRAYWGCSAAVDAKCEGQ